MDAISHKDSPDESPDLEKQEEPYRERAEHDDNSSAVYSAFSESRHAEGPASLRSTSMSRTTSRRLERSQTTASQALSVVRSRMPRAPFSHPLVNQKTKDDVIVTFDGDDDPYRPMNWPFRKKAITTFLYGMTTMTSTFASSVFSPAVSLVAEEFHVGNEVGTLGIALLLFGFGVGPLLWAPLSEVYGRRGAVLIPVFIAMLFSFGGGAAKDIQTIMLCRFFQGLFGSAPVTNTGGVLGDIWSAEQRGAAIVGYAMAVVGGPTV
nr:efflux pump bik6 [Quercus suber]